MRMNISRCLILFGLCLLLVLSFFMSLTVFEGSMSRQEYLGAAIVFIAWLWLAAGILSFAIVVVKN